MRTKIAGTGYAFSVAMVCLMLLGGAYAQSPTREDPNTVQIAWVANHGFQIAGAGKKVMIDTLFTQGASYYNPPTETTLARMKQSQAPFDGVDVVLITHAHVDHFDPNYAAEYLIHHPEVQFVGPEQTVASIQAHGEADTIKAKLLTAQGTGSGTYNGVEIEHITIPHHGSLEENIAYLVHINGVKILHIGDAAKVPHIEYEEFALDTKDIDILIAPFGAGCSNWLHTTSDLGHGPGTIRDFIKPKHIIMGHMSTEWWNEQEVIWARSQLQAQLPNISVSILNPQPCTGTLFAKDTDAIVELANPNGPVANQSKGQRFCSIRCALDGADPGDVLVLDPGIYPESITLDLDVTLQSLDPDDPYYVGGTIIQGDPHKPVVVLSNNTTACTLAGLTIRAGSIGISGAATRAIIHNCRIMDNVTHGLELSEAAKPHLLNCLITGNSETGITMYAPTGGRFMHCKPVIQNCVIVDNGAVPIVGGEPVIIDSLITGAATE